MAEDAVLVIERRALVAVLDEDQPNVTYRSLGDGASTTYRVAGTVLDSVEQRRDLRE